MLFLRFAASSFNQVNKFCINTDLEDYIKLLVFQLVIHIKTMCVFWGHSQGCFEENPKMLLATDSQENTIAHLVTASGNTEVFEVFVYFVKVIKVVI